MKGEHESRGHPIEQKWDRGRFTGTTMEHHGTQKNPAQQITKLEQQCLSKSFLLLVIWFSNKNPDWMTNERHGCQRLPPDYRDITTSRSKIPNISKSASQLNK